jgi:hypothetical protein
VPHQQPLIASLERIVYRYCSTYRISLLLLEEMAVEEAYLDESDVGRLLTEALTAHVEAVLADETGLVGADTAIQA